jgi:4-amino-4-deoxy-L-arabinose transferase-like glycosyltransferase
VAFHRSPFMRYYLFAGHALFGESGYGVILFQQVLRGVTALLTLGLTRLLTRHSGPGWLPAVITLCLPNPIGLSLYYWPETLGTVLFLVVCIGLVSWVRRPSIRGGIGTGLAVGVLCLVRTNTIGLIPPFFLGMLFRKRGRSGAGAFLLAAGAVLGLVPLRNYLVTHHWEPVATQGPVNLVLGNNIPRATDITFALTGEATHDRRLRAAMEHLYEFQTNPAAAFDVFPPESNAHMGPALTRVWLAYVAQHPGHYLGQVLCRAWSWFFPGWHVVSLLSLFAVGAFVFSGRGEDGLGWWILVGATAAQSLPFWLAYFEPRHRAVVLPEMVILSVLGGLAFRSWVRTKWGQPDRPPTVSARSKTSDEEE